MQDGSKRYIVAYTKFVGANTMYPAEVTCNKNLYFFLWEAERAAQIIGGWVIEVDLKLGSATVSGKNEEK